MGDPNKNPAPSLLGEAFRSELEEIVEAAIKKALNGNGHHDAVGEADRLSYTYSAR